MRVVKRSFFDEAEQARPPEALADVAADCARDGGVLVCPVTASAYELAGELPPDAMRASIAIRDWLLTEARTSRDASVILSGLCERLNAAELPVDRASIVLETLHSEHAALSEVWIKGEGVSAGRHPYTGGESDGYRKSPFYHVHQTRQHLALWLPDTPDARFGIVPDLKNGGYVHYLCFPVFFANGDENAVSFATRAPQGFSTDDIRFIQFIMPAVAAVMEIVGSYFTLDQLLRIYIGEDPHRLVLNGDVRRGQVSRIRSAILFADMRGYTQLSSGLNAEETVALLNAYFDCLVPPIEAEGGDVLKYMGDGLLAIFRDRGDDTGGAARAALDAAQEAFACLARVNAGGVFTAFIEMGIALHHGEAAYGNVGSGARLDFTVVGRDVNLTSRLSRLNKVLGEPLLMSQAFVEHLWADPKLLGAYALDDIPGEITVYRP